MARRRRTTARFLREKIGRGKEIRQQIVVFANSAVRTPETPATRLDGRARVSHHRANLQRALSPLVLLAVGFALLIVSWNRWSGLWTDAGRELYVPWRLSTGEVIYRDVHHLFGPLSAWINATLFAALKPGLIYLVGLNLVIVCVVTVILYRLFLACAGRLAATCCGTTFLAVFALSQYGSYGNFNWALPYSHELTHGVFFGLVSLCGLTRFAQSRRWCWLVLGGFALGCVALTKIEVFVAAGLTWCLGGAVACALCGPSAGTVARAVVTMLGASALPVVGAVIYFACHSSWAAAVEYLLTPYRLAADPSLTANSYYAWVMGTDRPIDNMSRLVLGSLAYAGVVALLVALGAALHRWRNVRAGQLVLLGLVALAVGVLAVQGVLRNVVYPLPCLLLVVVVVVGVGLRRRRHDPALWTKWLALFVFSIFALCLLAKIALKVTVWHYGFVLALPGSLILVACLTTYVPDLIAARFGHQALLRCAGTSLVLASVACHVFASANVYAIRNSPVGSGVDSILAWDPPNPAAARFELTLNSVTRHVGEQESFVVLPAGAMLNYMSRRPNPSPYVEFAPHVLASVGEEEMIAALDRDRPDYVVLHEWSNAAFGGAFLGVDYGLELWSWVETHYEPLEALADPNNPSRRFGIVMKLRDRL